MKLKGEGSMDKWQIEEDMRTLLRAEEIKRDPKRYRAAKKLAKERLEDMEAVVEDDDDKE